MSTICCYLSILNYNCLFLQGSQLYTHLTTSDYTGPEINYYNSGKVTLPSEVPAVVYNLENKVTAIIQTFLNILLSLLGK